MILKKESEMKKNKNLVLNPVNPFIRESLIWDEDHPVIDKIKVRVKQMFH